MATKEVGFLCVGASQFGTATKQVYTVPVDIASGVAGGASDPFYAARPEVAGKRLPFDTTPIEDSVPMGHSLQAVVPEPVRVRRIVIMKKRG